MHKDKLQNIVWDYYDKHGRDLPWRRTDDQYAIFVSEIMLQQTQVSRVIHEYKNWLDRWPDFNALAEADRSAVLKAWQGLGFNRRAKFLHESAQAVVNQHDGRLPQSRDKLSELSGVGDYTSGALMAFCFNKPVVFVETNIRSVFIYHFFADVDKVADADIRDKLQETMPADNIREWYYALMDYGAYIKDEYGNPNAKSDAYTTQSAFDGSNRQLRSQILRFILDNEPVKPETIRENIAAETGRQQTVQENLDNLENEQMITSTDNGAYQIIE